MARYKMEVDIPNTAFQEVGNPFFPGQFKDTSIPKKEKKYYDGYRQSCNSSLGIPAARKTLLEANINDNTNSGNINIPLLYYKGYVANLKDKEGRVIELDVKENKDNGQIIVSSNKT